MNTPEVVFFYASVLLLLFHSIFVTYSLFKPHVFHSFVNALNFVIFRDHCPHRPSILYLRLMLICGLLQGQMSSEQMNMCKHREKDDQKKNKQVLTTEQNGATKIAACRLKEWRTFFTYSNKIIIIVRMRHDYFYCECWSSGITLATMQL